MQASCRDPARRPGRGRKTNQQSILVTQGFTLYHRLLFGSSYECAVSAGAGPQPWQAMHIHMATKRKRPSCTQLNACIRNRIIGMALAGAAPSTKASTIRKPDRQPLKVDAVRKTIRKFKANPTWNGDRKQGTGPTHLLSIAQKTAIARIVFKHRGSKVVTINLIKRLIVAVRHVSRQTISRALHEAGLAWLRRRRKHCAPAQHVNPRIA